MLLPVMPPVAPMLAKPVADIPNGMFYEPKWDGFRSIVFRDGAEVEIGSRNGRPMTRYFPEVVAAIIASLPPRCVIDGEIIIASPDKRGLDFWALQQRIHPAASRVRMLAEQTPASFIAFDVLALDDADLTPHPFSERRAALERALACATPPVHLTPITRDRRLAELWFDRFEGAGLDGLIAKSSDQPYEPNKRVMTKIKHERTADCVVAGYRVHKTRPDAIGSLLLGLHNDAGALTPVGWSARFRWPAACNCWPTCSRWSSTSPTTRGNGRQKWRPPSAMLMGAGGIPPRTCHSFRFVPSGWSRCATTTWRDSGCGTPSRGSASGTPPSSSAGARTVIPPRATTTSSPSRCHSTLRRSSPVE
jgi:hypothetical protein